MKITVIGTGYVGLVSGLCFAKIGHEVTCVDNNQDKVNTLLNGEIPIFEPGLKEILDEAKKSNNINFSSSLKDIADESQAIFIAVGTPQGEDGRANLEFVFNVAREIAQNITSYKAIITKSTVPVGTGEKVAKIIKEENPDVDFSVISNPEFLREGKAIEDFLKPDRIVVGTSDKKGRNIMAEIYAPLVKLNNNKELVQYTDITTSELIKYASNSFLATKVAFINEMANLCEKVGANIQDLSFGLGTDSRIGEKFLNPGPGFGGSCFPKDILALNAIAQDNNTKLSLIDAVIDSNNDRKADMAQKIIRNLGGNVKNKTICVLGLAFKADTDDIRYSPAIAIIKELLKAGANIKTFDPQGMDNAKKEIKSDNISFCSDEYDASDSSNALVVATEWEQFSKLDLAKIKGLLANPLIIDLRNMLDPGDVKKLNIKYISIGSREA